MFNLDAFVNVKCHPYRTAKVFDRFFEIDRMTPEARKFEEKLAKAANVSIDNHVVYTIKGNETFCHNGEIHVWCTDGLMLVGSDLVLVDW